jgi:hypothetical protein
VGAGRGDGISEGVEVTDWRSEPVSLVVVIDRDTVSVPIGQSDTIYAFVRNWSDPAGMVDIAIGDTMGWYQGPVDLSVEMDPVLGASVAIPLVVPADVPEGHTSELTFAAIAQTDPDMMVVLSLEVVSYKHDPQAVAVTSQVEATAVPEEYGLQQNYPNPFNPVTTIRYQLPAPGYVRLVIYNQVGQEVKILLDDIQPAGWYRALWDGSQCANGVYLYRLEAGSFVKTRSMVLLK